MLNLGYVKFQLYGLCVLKWGITDTAKLSLPT